MKPTKTHNMRWLTLSIFVLVLDRISKTLAVTHLVLGEPGPVIPQLNFRLAHNTGTAFSLLDNARGWQNYFLSFIAIAVSLFLIKLLYDTARNQNWQAAAIALILGGAIGNLWDRLQFGFVIDFIDFHLNHWHFATFNIADSAITVGVIMYLIDILKRMDFRCLNK